MGIKTEDAEVPITAIVDGKAVADCFGNVNIDENEAKLIAISNGEQPQNILVMTIKNDGTAYIVAKEEQ